MTQQPAQAKSPEQAIREALQKLADAISDVTGLEVVTSIQVINPKNPSAAPGKAVDVAKTNIKIDGDRYITVPVVMDEAEGMKIEKEVYDLHERNVQEAMEYRKQALASLVDFVKTKKVA